MAAQIIRLADYSAQQVNPKPSATISIDGDRVKIEMCFCTGETVIQWLDAEEAEEYSDLLRDAAADLKDIQHAGR